VAISNCCLLDLRDGRVTFRYKDYADAHRKQDDDARRDEFLRRFVQHVLPKSFVTIRHYGLLANVQREVRLALCDVCCWCRRWNAGMPNAEAVAIQPANPLLLQCGGRRLIYRELAAAAPTSSSTAAVQDSS